MRTLLLLLLLPVLLVVPVCGADPQPAAKNPGGELLIPLKTGKEKHVSYGLYSIITDSPTVSNDDADLLLVLRNTSAKFLSMATKEDEFRLVDAKGQPVKFFLKSNTIGMAYGEVEDVHLNVPDTAAPRPWSLHYQRKTDPILNWSFSITGIDPRGVPAGKTAK